MIYIAIKDIEWTTQYEDIIRVSKNTKLILEELEKEKGWFSVCDENNKHIINVGLTTIQKNMILLADFREQQINEIFE